MAGIVLPILIIAALVAGGAVAGILVWKYQPWHNILSKKGKDDGEYRPCVQFVGIVAAAYIKTLAKCFYPHVESKLPFSLLPFHIIPLVIGDVMIVCSN